MERETIKITTPLEKHEVVLKAWLTGGERRALRNAFLSKMDISVGEDKVNTEKVNSAEVIEEAENKTFETVIVSIDGDSKDIVKRLLEMRDTDYNFVTEEIKKITEEKSFFESKTAQ
jgi:hypothetical protein